MSLYIRLHTNFWTHRKTMRLKTLIGNDAFWIPQRLWSYAAENQPDGDFSAYQAEELCMLIGCSSNACSMLEALQKSGFMDGMKIHDWNEHNEYHHTFSERAKKAAKARWNKEESTKEEMKGQDKKGKEQALLEHAPSISKPKNKLISEEEFLATLKASPAYSHVNVPVELSKMDLWLMAHPGRKKTRRFVTNWLNGVEAPLTINGQKPESITDSWDRKLKEREERKLNETENSN